MVLGYNERRPRTADYQIFLERITRGLRAFVDSGLSLMIYGSYVRGDYTPGRSDIDGVLIFPDDVVTNKPTIREISLLLHNTLREHSLSFQVTPLDVTVMRDGRFNSFTKDFAEYFHEEGKVLVGPDYRDEMVCLPQKTGEEVALSHNLRKIRQALLFAEHDRHKRYERFLERFNKTLDAVSRGSKQILYLTDNRLRKNRFSALEELSHIFPHIDTEPLQHIKYLYTHPEKLDRLYESSQRVIQTQETAVTFLEQMLREYINQFPREERKAGYHIASLNDS